MELVAAILGRPVQFGWSGIVESHSSTFFLNSGKFGSLSAGVGWRSAMGRQLYSLQQDDSTEQCSSHLGGLFVCCGANPRRWCALS